MGEANKLEKDRIKPIKLWFSDWGTILLVAILILSFIIRLYYLSSTVDQPLWWDEAEYMLKAKSIAFGLPDSGWSSERPIIAPLVLAILFKLGFAETGIRFFMVLLSLGALVLVYLIGKELFDKKVAIIGTLIFSGIYLNLFYTARILLNIPELLIGLLIFYIFILAYLKNKNYLWIIIPLSIVGFYLRFTVAIYVGIILATIFLVREFSILKDKKLKYVAGVTFLAGVLAVSLLAIFYKFNPISAFLKAIEGGIFIRHSGESIYFVSSSYLLTIYTALKPIFLIFLLFGILAYLWKFIFLIDKNIKSPDRFAKSRLFVVIWIFFTLFFYGVVMNHFEDRYLMMIFPVLCLLSAQGFFSVFEFLKKYNKEIVAISLAGLFIFAAYQNLTYSEQVINSRINSYSDLKDAGLWIKKNSAIDSVVFSSGMPQNTYYSERKTLPYPRNESEFQSLIEKEKPKFMILTLLEKSPDWAYNWTEKNKDKITIVKAYFLDPQQTQASTIIYQFN